ncbi:enoyl-CoA hydratase/isomerase family protein [Mycolicibacterium pulveris]|uniref:Enoyl-CoA hydratase n=1 Tax=Mycolicibacterium pulveris TaxID=36813 RepID=A0A7I7UPW2_MYCPV|nr:enoyl-CoA hydratase/isomerase family protein [Mycolicibacterium pulveris]MCV6983558.1 enoyl-CoA hydratase/isomerase family protein [Mycolicibacterium pulveris]BBY83438.1 enoyl-CoA hydratase [Mycolicibacterium pulveris]
MSQPNYEAIKYHVSSPVAYITLARPDTLNLIGETVFDELTDAFIRARFEPGVSVVVLQSTGKMFSAGGDLNQSVTTLARNGPSAELRTEMFKHVYADYPIFHAIETCPHTVVAAMNGPAMGAAVTIIMMCDLVVAAETATVTFAPGRWGIADAPSAARLSQKVGVGTAKDLLFTARTISAETALEYGLVQRVAQKDELADAVEELIDQLLTTPPSVRAALKAVFYEQQPPIRTDAHYRSAISTEFLTGLEAFSSGNPPPWTVRTDDARSPDLAREQH